ncbi:MAG TPA: hypothetical protein VFF67_10070 [Thermoplasmata archaeon]|nr:hypothetical protein [Thermoplasmata archaeon]
MTRKPPILGKLGSHGCGIETAAASVLLLLVSASPAGAAAPVFSYAPPLTGTTFKDSNSTTVFSCGNFAQISDRGTLNLSTGRFSFAANGTAGLCNGRAAGGFGLVTLVVITSPTFTVNTSGLFVLKTNWILNISANATLFDNSGVGAFPDGQASAFVIQFTVHLMDLTPFGASASGSFTDYGKVLDMNGTVHFQIARHVKMPLAVILTSGDIYVVRVTLKVGLQTHTLSHPLANSTASADVNFAPGGHSSVFQGFSIA